MRRIWNVMLLFIWPELHCAKVEICQVRALLLVAVYKTTKKNKLRNVKSSGRWRFKSRGFSCWRWRQHGPLKRSVSYHKTIWRHNAEDLEKLRQLTNYMKDSRRYEANSRSAGQKIHRLLSKPEVHYTFRKSQLLVPTQSYMNPTEKC